MTKRNFRNHSINRCSHDARITQKRGPSMLSSVGIHTPILFTSRLMREIWIISARMFQASLKMCVFLFRLFLFLYFLCFVYFLLFISLFELFIIEVLDKIWNLPEVNFIHYCTLYKNHNLQSINKRLRNCVPIVWFIYETSLYCRNRRINPNIDSID